MFEGLGAFVFRYRWAVLVSSGALLVLAACVLVRGGSLISGVIHGLEAEKAREVVAAVTGRDEETTVVAVLHAQGMNGREPAFADAARAALAPLHDDPRVVSVISPEDLPESYAAPLVDGRTQEAGGAELAIITMAGDYREALAAYPAVRAELHSDRLSIDCTGRVPYMHDLDRILEHDLLRAEMVSLPLALLVLLYVFRTVTAATLPVGVGALAVVGGIAIVTALSRVTEIAQYTINVCSLIGTGIAIDYSLFIVSRYREELAAGKDLREALSRAMATAGRVVGFSGVAVATGLGGLLFFDGSYLFAMGVGGIIVVALGVVFALTFLPALLAVLGPRIDAGRLPGPRARAVGLWHGTALRVMRRPLLFLLPTLGLLLTMGLPFLHIRLAAADVRVLPDEAEARRGYELLRVHFPDRAANRIVVAVRFPSSPMEPERMTALRALEARMAALPGVREVDGPTSDPSIPMGDDAIVLYAIADAPPESLEARAIVHALRADRAVADGTLLVGGTTANDVDVTAYMLARAPKAVAIVVLATVVVVFLLLGSVVLPIKAVILNFVLHRGVVRRPRLVLSRMATSSCSEGRPVEPSLPISSSSASSSACR